MGKQRRGELRAPFTHNYCSTHTYVFRLSLTLLLLFLHLLVLSLSLSLFVSVFFWYRIVKLILSEDTCVQIRGRSHSLCACVYVRVGVCACVHACVLVCVCVREYYCVFVCEFVWACMCVYRLYMTEGVCVWVLQFGGRNGIVKNDTST